ncbi:MAG: M50 family metallopeptidase, partial [Pedosphaera parvula]|nr:M50 family metallopeptidase [Pedosphaera parvula]
MPKWVKAILAVLLLPVCIGAAKALWRVLQASGSADTFWVAMLAGAACWVVIFLLLPKPMWLYVVGHEMTHALWTWLFGGRVKSLKATSKGGQVVVTRSNFLIVLAPYFFP